ncbi:hypothetical protein FNV43_RR00135 [Rhamnella rubrinervis]|uniref:Uncharacterized protein n=1 Tax=Rhamnella rubrinervis TaxID=2594499 RepID=A0A8K0HPS9_9ROSA|nr:hypothetical protein FNV43_RR00135 [Rhamnella rubrinervis]
MPQYSRRRDKCRRFAPIPHATEELIIVTPMALMGLDIADLYRWLVNASFCSTDYFSKWVEANPTLKDKDGLGSYGVNIICRYGLPRILIMIMGPVHRRTQRMVAESTNKTIAFQEAIEKAKGKWPEELPCVLGERTTPHRNAGNPFRLLNDAAQRKSLDSWRIGEQAWYEWRHTNNAITKYYNAKVHPRSLWLETTSRESLRNTQELNAGSRDLLGRPLPGCGIPRPRAYTLQSLVFDLEALALQEAGTTVRKVSRSSWLVAVRLSLVCSLAQLGYCIGRSCLVKVFSSVLFVARKVLFVSAELRDVAASSCKDPPLLIASKESLVRANRIQYRFNILCLRAISSRHGLDAPIATGHRHPLGLDLDRADGRTIFSPVFVLYAGLAALLHGHHRLFSFHWVGARVFVSFEESLLLMVRSRPVKWRSVVPLGQPFDCGVRGEERIPGKVTLGVVAVGSVCSLLLLSDGQYPIALE